MKKIKKEVEVEVEEPKGNGLPPVEIQEAVAPKIGLLTQEFGNGELNILKDKLNELIKLNN